jgi:hypothetical protein
MKDIKRILPILLILLLSVSFSIAQPKVKIKTEAVTTYDLTIKPLLAPDSTVQTGLHVVGNKTMVFVNAYNFGDATAITNASWTLLQKPTGSNTSISAISGMNWWAKFRPDSTGLYQVKVTITTSSGSKDTTYDVYAANFVGTGNFQGVPAVYPNCMTCHAGMPAFVSIFDRWKNSGHANLFKFEIDSGSATYSTNCMKCHVTGTDHNSTVDNHGFDDVARTLGWNWNNFKPPKPGNWDSLKTKFPSLVAFSSIGCESCHGPGSLHALSGDTNKIEICYDPKVCVSCHDAPTHHIKPYQWEQAMHSNVVYSSSFAQATTNANFGTNNLENCIRCHDGKGYINFTYGRGTNTSTYNLGAQVMVGCQTCHDQHGNSNDYYIRNRPTNSDTLATGYKYNELGAGKLCADCHKSRKNNVSYIQTRVTSSTWGPHHSTQSDNLLGKNAAMYGGIPYISGSHKNVVSDGCIGCHMAPTADTGTPNVNKVGEHTFKITNEATGFENIANACGSCHPGKTNLDQFIAPDDYDGDGLIEPWQKEIDGLLKKVRIKLPPQGVDSVAWQLIAADSFNVDLRRMYWNYQFITNDGSRGMHNPFFTVNVLLSTLANPYGVQQTGTEIPAVYALSQNYPNPFNPTTKINFAIPKSQNVTVKIYNIMGQEVYTLIDKKLEPGKYTATWDAVNNSGYTVSSGVYFYRITAGDYVDTKKMILVR